MSSPAAPPRLIQQSLVTLFEAASKKALVDRPLVRSGSDSASFVLPGGLFEVRPSLIPKAGRGLFALQRIKQGRKIGRYSGQRLSEREAKRSSSVYLMRVRPGLVIDGAPASNAMRWVNGSDSEEQANVRAVSTRLNTPDEHVAFYAKRALEPGDELLLFYGNAYWRDKSPVS